MFVHVSAVQTPGFKELHVSDRVEYDLARGPKGSQAENVTVDRA
ncbi:cold-shock protein [Streptomyces sp. NPDC001127]